MIGGSGSSTYVIIISGLFGIVLLQCWVKKEKKIGKVLSAFYFLVSPPVYYFYTCLSTNICDASESIRTITDVHTDKLEFSMNILLPHHPLSIFIF